MFKNLTIKARLIFVITLLSVLLAGVGAVGLHGMSTANDSLQSVYADRAVPMGQIAQIQQRLLRNRLLIATALVTPTPEVIRDNTAEIEQNIAEITKTWGAYMATYLTPEEKQLADKFAEDRGRFVKEGLKPAMAALRAGDLKETNRIVVEKIRPLYVPVGAGIDALMQLQLDVAKQLYTEAEHQYGVIRNISVGSIVLGTLLAALIGFLLIRAIVQPLQRAVALAEAVAGGDLSSRIDVSSNDEVGKLLQALKRMTESLSLTVSAVRTSTDTITTASSEIASGNTDLSSRTEEQASSLEETASSMEELTSTVKQNAENARQANQLSISASAIAVKGGDVVREVVGTMTGISDSSKKIADIISVIDGIAFQTNILALNAAVEAARAGEQGRGFAVVASEVRNLAQRSAAAAKEIKELISDSVEKVSVGTRLVDQAGKTMEEIVTSVKRVTDIMSEITAASQEQSSGIEQVNQAITQMDEVTQQNAALVEEAAAAASSLSDEAQNLAKAVAVFRIGHVEQPQAAHSAATPAKPAHAASLVERRSPNRAKNVTRLPAAKAAAPARTAPAAAPAAAKASGTDDQWQEF